jgi:hypothetical protein
MPIIRWKRTIRDANIINSSHKKMVEGNEIVDILNLLIFSVK